MLGLMEETFLINQEKMVKEHNNIQKITNGQGDDYKTSCLLDYSYFKKI